MKMQSRIRKIYVFEIRAVSIEEGKLLLVGRMSVGSVSLGWGLQSPTSLCTSKYLVKVLRLLKLSRSPLVCGVF